MLWYLLASCMILQMGCNKDKGYTGDTYAGAKVMVLGHAGMGIYFNMPPNSFESISTAIDIGCDGSELDVQLTKDSVLVAFHDEDLALKTDCDGPVYNYDWEEIKACKYDLAVKPAFLITLKELFEKLKNSKDLYFSFDCKIHVPAADKDEYENRMLRAIKRLCEDFKMENHILIEGSKEFLDKAAIMGLKTKLFLFSNNDDNPVDKAKGKYFGITTTMEISKEDIEKAAQNKLYVMVWAPGNYTQNKHVLDRKPDIIQTDDPISILKLLKRFNYENVTP